MHGFNTARYSPASWHECANISPTSAYGHFGRTAGEAGPGSFSWEATNLVDTLIAALR